MTSPASKLWPIREQVLGLIADSTGLHPLNADVAAVVGKALEAYEQQRQAALRLTQERSAATRGAIVQALGAGPLTLPDATLLALAERRMGANPGKYGVDVPCARVIREVVREMKNNQGLSGPKVST